MVQPTLLVQLCGGLERVWSNHKKAKKAGGQELSKSGGGTFHEKGKTGYTRLLGLVEQHIRLGLVAQAAYIRSYKLH